MNTGRDKPRDSSDTANLPEANASQRRLDAETESVGKGGLLIVGHGTRDPVGVGEFREATARITTQAATMQGGPQQVAGCFLELAEPTIDAAVARLAAAGLRRITVAPLILFAAGHAKRDIPDAVAAAAERYGIEEVRHLPHLGCRPELVALSARRFHEATRHLEPIAQDETLLLMVGRGSRDDEATAEMHRFAKLRAAATPVGRLEVGFTAMAKPSLDEAIEAVARLPYRRIIVQPHLLFAGELLEKVRATTARAAEANPRQEWIAAGHLGPEPEIALAVVSHLTGS
jgi:sirohydrochlorin cobaltochelatase